MWSPKRNRNGSKSVFYDNMAITRPGDVIFSYYNGAISAVGRVVSQASSSPKPDFGNVGANWGDDGWEVDVHFAELDDPVDPRTLLALYNQCEPVYGPMNEVGNVNQFYLFGLPEVFGAALLGLCAPNGLGEVLPIQTDDEFSNPDLVQSDLDFGATVVPTVRRQLGLARVGQGLFRNRVAQLESACRITGVQTQRHLVASHMKPWKSSNDQERLDGANGLLLSPHVDHLFDRGFLTFENSGESVLSSATPSEVVSKWRLREQRIVRPFRAKQLKYLEYHRESVFERWSGS